MLRQEGKVLKVVHRSKSWGPWTCVYVGHVFVSVGSAWLGEEAVGGKGAVLTEWFVRKIKEWFRLEKTLRPSSLTRKPALPRPPLSRVPGTLSLSELLPKMFIYKCLQQFFFPFLFLVLAAHHGLCVVYLRAEPSSLHPIILLWFPPCSFASLPTPYFCMINTSLYFASLYELHGLIPQLIQTLIRKDHLCLHVPSSEPALPFPLSKVSLKAAAVFSSAVCFTSIQDKLFMQKLAFLVFIKGRRKTKLHLNGQA